MKTDPTSICFLLLSISFAIALIMIALDALLTLYVHKFYKATLAKLRHDEEFQNLLLSSNVSSKEIAKRVVLEHEKTTSHLKKEIARDMTRHRIRRIVEKERQQALLNSLAYWKTNGVEETARQTA